MSPPGSADRACLRPSVTLTFDHLTLKMVCESRWRTFNPNLGTLGLRVLNYALCMRRTDRQTDGSNAYCPFPTVAVGGIITMHTHIRLNDCLVFEHSISQLKWQYVQSIDISIVGSEVQPITILWQAQTWYDLHLAVTHIHVLIDRYVLLCRPWYLCHGMHLCDVC